MPRSLLLAVLAMLVLPRMVGAQDRLVERSGFYLGMNVLVGGGAAVAHALVAPGDPPLARAFLQGALGGAVAYGGQRMVGTGVPALRLSGVQTVALGASIARNAGAGARPFEELTFPLFPLYVHVRPHADRSVRIRVSAVALASLGLAAANTSAYDASLDVAESLLTGAPVFRSRASWIYAAGAPSAECAHGDGCAGAAAGLHRLGTTWYTTGGRSAAQSRRILAHETVHLTQFVRDAILFGVPTGDAITRGAGGVVGRIGELVALDAFLPLALVNQGLSMAMPAAPEMRSWRIYEFEARALSGTR
jgi:hypothetical protein